MSEHRHTASETRLTVQAILLAILVACGLLYGVIETVMKIPALFGA
jgi:hypothetical protein